MSSVIFAAMLALAPCDNIYAVKRIWDTNEYYVQYQKNGPWFWIDGKEFLHMNCYIQNYVVVG
jgi:hypothetical protein